jgi:hypothetical protein
MLPMAASLESRSSRLCFFNFSALPFFDFGDGTDEFSKSSSELESDSSCCDLCFFRAERLFGAPSELESESSCSDFRFLCDERVSVVRTGEPLSFGVL